MSTSTFGFTGSCVYFCISYTLESLTLHLLVKSVKTELYKVVILIGVRFGFYLNEYSYPEDRGSTFV
jgi:hypothetical protein